MASVSAPPASRQGGRARTMKRGGQVERLVGDLGRAEHRRATDQHRRATPSFRRAAAGSWLPSHRTRPRQCGGSERRPSCRSARPSATPRSPKRFQVAKSLSCTTGYAMPSFFVAAATLSYGFSQKNSGVWTPTIVSPCPAYRSCHARNCGTTFLQLIQPYVQKSMSTTRPRSRWMVSGSLLIQAPPPPARAPPVPAGRAPRQRRPRRQESRPPAASRAASWPS